MCYYLSFGISVRRPAKYTSLFWDGIFDDSTLVFTVLFFFCFRDLTLLFLCHCHAVYANSILALYATAYVDAFIVIIFFFFSSQV